MKQFEMKRNGNVFELTDGKTVFADDSHLRRCDRFF